MLSKERPAEYVGDSRTKADVPTSCPAIAKPHVSGCFFVQQQQLKK